MIELAFLRAFLGWEVFLEESFILYLTGQKPPRGRAPHRYTRPPDYAAATEWVVPEERPYANWAKAGLVRRRAERHFRDGGLFAAPLKQNSNALDEARLIRNAVTHQSVSARLKFESLVRTKLLTLPRNLSVGGFLRTVDPHSAPPVTFLEFYIGKIELAAQQIVPR